MVGLDGVSWLNMQASLLKLPRGQLYFPVAVDSLRDASSKCVGDHVTMKYGAEIGWLCNNEVYYRNVNLRPCDASIVKHYPW